MIHATPTITVLYFYWKWRPWCWYCTLLLCNENNVRRTRCKEYKIQQVGPTVCQEEWAKGTPERIQSQLKTDKQTGEGYKASLR